MLKKIFTIVLVLTCTTVLGQDSLNIKFKNNTSSNLISINGLGSFPLAYHIVKGFDNHLIKEKSGALEPGKTNFDFGANIGFMHYTSGRFGFGVEYNVEFNKMHPDSKLTPSSWQLQYQREYGTPDDRKSGGVDLNHEAISVITHTVMPVIEWSPKKKKLLPLSFHNQFGIGYSLTKVIEKDYAYDVGTIVNNRYTTFEHPGSTPINAPGGKIYSSSDSVFNYDEFYDYDNVYSALKIMYSTHFRFKLSEQLLLNLGARFNVNYYFKAFDGIPADSSPEQNSNFINREEMRNYIAHRRIFSIGSLTLGLSYKF